MQQRNNKPVKAILVDGSEIQGMCLEYGQFGFSIQEGDKPSYFLKFEDTKEIIFMDEEAPLIVEEAVPVVDNETVIP